MTGVAMLDLAGVRCPCCQAVGSVEAVSRGAGEAAGQGGALKVRRPVYGCKLCGWVGKEVPCTLCGLLPSQGLVLDKWGVLVDDEVLQCRLEDQRRGEPGGGGSGPKRGRKPGDDLLRGRAEQEPWPGLVERDQDTVTERPDESRKTALVQCRATAGEKSILQLVAKANRLSESELVNLAIRLLLFGDCEEVQALKLDLFSAGG